MAKKQECSIHQEPEITPVIPEVKATKAYLLAKLNALEKSVNEARWHEEKLAEEIKDLEDRRRGYCGTLARELEEKNHLLKLYKELGGNEWEVTG
jgi:hypothetical protein